MCRVLVERNPKNLDYVVYNSIYALPKMEFTISSLIDNLKKNGFEVQDTEVKKIVKRFQKNGLVRTGLHNFSLITA